MADETTTTGAKQGTGSRGRLATVKEAVPDPAQIKQGATKAATEIKQGASKAATGIKDGASKAATGLTSNPLALGLLSAAGGFAVGMVVPLTEFEKQSLPDVADRAKSMAVDAIEQTKTTGMTAAADQIESVGDAAIGAVVETAKKIPGIASVADKVEESARRGTRKMAQTVRSKAGS